MQKGDTQDPEFVFRNTNAAVANIPIGYHIERTGNFVKIIIKLKIKRREDLMCILAIKIIVLSLLVPMNFNVVGKSIINNLEEVVKSLY